MFVAEAGLQLEKMRNKSSRKAQLITQEDDSEKGTSFKWRFPPSVYISLTKE